MYGKRAVHSPPGKDSLPEAVFEENVSCAEAAPVFHVRPFLSLQKDSPGLPWELSASLLDIFERRD